MGSIIPGIAERKFLREFLRFSAINWGLQDESLELSSNGAIALHSIKGSFTALRMMAFSAAKG